MKQQKRKGFTLVELLVVIAILAVLATVSIVGYTSFIKKANVSNDTALVTQINNLLLANDTSNGGQKSATMYDALTVLKADGFDVTKFTPTTEGYHFVWDSEENRFLFLNEDQQVVAPSGAAFEKSVRYFAVVHNETDIETTWAGCSIYLADDYNGSKVFNNLSTGFDAGTCEGVTSVTYTGSGSARKIIIRVNSSATTVTATAYENVDKTESDTILAYGWSGPVNVLAAGDHSFHWYGQTDSYISVTKGRIVAEEGSQGIIKAMSNYVTVEVANSAEITVVPGADGVILATVAPDVPASKKSDSVPATGFAGGLGTEASPYLIADEDQWLSFRNSELTDDGLYWSVISDLDFGSEAYKAATVKTFWGSIDFNNHKVVNLQMNDYTFNGDYWSLFYNVTGNTEIKNLDFYAHSTEADKVSRLILNIEGTSYNITLKNVDVYGNVTYTDNNTGAYLHSTYGSGSITFDSCDNYMNITNTGYTGMYVGRVYSATDLSLTFRNCTNYGNATTTGRSVAMLISNPTRHDQTELTLTVENCVNNGVLLGTTGCNYLAVNSGALISDSELAALQNNGIANGPKGVLMVAQNATFDVVDGKYALSSVTNATRYELTFTFSGCTYVQGGIVSVSFALTESELNSVYAYDWIDISEATNVVTENKYGITLKTSDENYVFDVINDSGNQIGLTSQSKVSVVFAAYNEDGELLDISIYPE